MEQRIAELERKLRTTSAITWVLAFLLVGVAVLTQIPIRTPQVIFVGDQNGAHTRIGPEGLYLVAADGRPRASVDLVEGSPRVALFDAKGTEGGSLRLTDEGVSLNLKSAPGAQVFLNADNQATLLVDSGGGRGKLVVEATAGRTQMALDGGSQGTATVKIMAAATGASIVANHPSVPVTAALFTTADASGLALGRADSPGKLTAERTAAALFSVDADGNPAMQLRKADGTSRIIAPQAQ
ncbi:MAG: hypothetical protein H6706_11345 [Myxococcales bacterium]|nr:hypothetical protein [Myxococcales bacterium]